MIEEKMFLFRNTGQPSVHLCRNHLVVHALHLNGLCGSDFILSQDSKMGQHFSMIKFIKKLIMTLFIES